MNNMGGGMNAKGQSSEFVFVCVFVLVYVCASVCVCDLTCVLSGA